jgi:hypothetical protein
MKHILFWKIMNVVSNHDSYFVQHKDVCGRMSLSTILKCIFVLKMLAYDVATDATNEYCRLAKNTTTKCLKRFIKMIHAIFECEYLW